MDLGIIIAIGGSSVAIIGVMIALMLWVRSEGNSDRRDIFGLISAIQAEIKDFHGRLCAIEERNSRR